MTDHPKPDTPQNQSSSSSSFSSTKLSPQTTNTSTEFSGHNKARYPNPPDHSIPDPATLRDQWRFAIRQYSRWYSQAWGTAILAGLSFFALGWIIKGSNPLPSLQDNSPAPPPPSSSSSSSSDANESRQ